MKKIKFWALALPILSLGFLLSSCGPTAVTVAERPVEPVYVQTVSPGPGYVWVGREWVRRGYNYGYRPGYWAVPPRPRVVYHEGGWHESRRGYYYQPGRWQR